MTANTEKIQNQQYCLSQLRQMHQCRLHAKLNRIYTLHVQNLGLILDRNIEKQCEFNTIMKGITQVLLASLAR